MMETDTKLVALLPLKAHSERVPGKNFRDFAGMPLFRWMLDRLLAIPRIGQVVINTDAREELEAAGLPQTGRLRLRERAEHLRGDLTSMNWVLEDDVRAVEADLYLMTHVTNPLLSVATIERALRVFETKRRVGYDSLFSVTKRQGRFYRKDGGAVNHDPTRLMRTQDLEMWYEENSNLYLFTRESFMATRARIGRRPWLFETPCFEAVDIDDEESWRMAERLAWGYAKERSLTPLPLAFAPGL